MQHVLIEKITNSTYYITIQPRSKMEKFIEFTNQIDNATYRCILRDDWLATNDSI